MSWLHILFNSLTDREMNLVDNIRLIGKEREVFDYILGFRNKMLPDNEQRDKSIQITNTHYYKINSVLIQKCFHKLVPTGGMELLEFMKKKNLFTLLRHEIATNHESFTLQMNMAEKEEFYLACFRILIDLPFKFYDDVLVEKFGNLYLNHKANRNDSDDYYIQYHKLFADCNRYAARKNPAKAFQTTLNELLKHEEELLGTTHYVALYYLYRTFCSYFTFYENSPNKQLEYMNKAIALKDKIKSFFPINISLFLDLMYADVLFNNYKQLEAFKIYQKAFNEGVKHDMYGYYYHCENYALLALVNNEFDKAEKVLQSNFEDLIENSKDIYATRGALAFTKLYLSKDDFKLALKYINAAKQINEKAFYIPFDMQIRVLENVYFYLKGDYEFAYQLAQRNLKFLNSQVRKSTLAKEYIAFWKALSSILLAIEKGNQVPRNTAKVFARLERNFRYLYANIFSIIVAKIPAKNNLLG